MILITCVEKTKNLNYVLNNCNQSHTDSEFTRDNVNLHLLRRCSLLTRKTDRIIKQNINSSPSKNIY